MGVCVCVYLENMILRENKGAREEACEGSESKMGRGNDEIRV